MEPRWGSETAVALVMLLAARGTMAHEHHNEKIVEGEYVSADPLVCWLQRIGEEQTEEI